MDKAEAARQLLGCIGKDGGLRHLAHYMLWDPRYPERATLDSEFDADELEAIAWWMRNMRSQPPYPWCHGSPSREECARRGFCNRDPNCGE